VAGARAARDLGFTTILLHHGPDQPYGMVRRHKFEQFVAAHPDGPLIPLKGNDAMTAYALAPPAESVIETPLAPRLPVATVVGEVRRREEAIVLPPGGRAVFYLPLEVGSRLRGWVESGTGVLEVADESGEGIPLEIAPGPVDLDLSPFDGELLRIALEGGATGARWRDLRMVAPAPRVYPSAIPRARHDVLMILLDSLRADEIEGAGGVVGLTPTIAALADGGVRFDEARAPASWTRPSVASLLSSVSPTTHQISLLVEALPEGVRIPTTVDLVDVAPTLLDLLGLEAAEGMQGRSLVPLIEGVAESESPRSFVAESLAGFQAALRLGRWKLVRDAWSASDASISKSGAPWLSISQIVAIEDVDVAATPLVYSLYDLSSDPGEERDLVAERPFVAAALGQLLAWERHRLAPGEPARDVSVDALGADELEHLKALGYVE
jgi:hypothetical protein